jgi:hypothetical protein
LDQIAAGLIDARQATALPRPRGVYVLIRNAAMPARIFMACNMGASLYEPINVYKPVAQDIGIVDGPFEYLTVPLTNTK